MGAVLCCYEGECPNDNDIIDDYLIIPTKEQLGNPILTFIGFYTIEETAVCVFNSPNLFTESNVYLVKNKVVEVVTKQDVIDLFMIKKQLKHMKENTELFK